MSAAGLAVRSDYPRWNPEAVLGLPLRLMHAWVSAPAFLFCFALTAMLFRPPDLKAFPLDRVALVLLTGAFALRVCARAEKIKAYPASWPLLALTILASATLLGAPFQTQAWSLLAAKWAVPLLLFHIAGAVFKTPRDLRKLELFCVLILLYLSVISIFSLFGVESLIFPRYILDPGIGIHADRARGPFLQAVANGVSLNILGLVALNAFCRGGLPRSLAAIFAAAVPLALLATKTRAVWISAAFTVAALIVFSGNRRVRRAAMAVCVLVCIGALTFFVQSAESLDFAERLKDQSPVDFRSEIYSAGWQMFTEKPLFGWGDEEAIQAEVAQRVSTFRPDYFVFHNTFLEIAVQRGLVGIGLYAWLIVCLFRLAARPASGLAQNVFDADFRRLWPVVLGVYLINASAVVMNYQFVNGLLFTFAGILAAQKDAAVTIRPAGRS